MPTPEWIGVDQVATEMNLTRREAWELVRRIGVPMLEAGRGRMERVRFRRSDWEDRRDAATKPAEPRRRYTQAQTPPAVKTKPVAKADAAAVAAMLNKIRNA